MYKQEFTELKQMALVMVAFFISIAAPVILSVWLM